MNGTTSVLVSAGTAVVQLAAWLLLSSAVVFAVAPSMTIAWSLSVLNGCWVVGMAALQYRVARSHQRLRARLHLREQQIAADASTTSEWLWECDQTGRMTFSNRGALHLLGYSVDQLLGRSPMEFVAGEAARTQMRRYLDALFEGAEGTFDVELPWRDRSGQIVALEGSLVALRDVSGRVIGARGSRRLATSGRTARRQASQTHQRVSALLDSDDLTIALQPIVDIHTGRLAGVEALARFADGRAPDEWFADALAAGLRRQLEFHAFAKALQVLAVLPEGCYLSVNASPELLGDGEMRARLFSDAPLHRLVVEITEHARVRDYDALVAVMAPLRRRGLRFAVDDTGAGYASFNHVLRLRPDMIKIDRSLLEDLEIDPARRTLVTALVLLALDLGATLTGEGVESVEQLDALASLGVDRARGYLLARPSTEPSVWRSWSTRQWAAAGSASPLLSAAREPHRN